MPTPPTSRPKADPTSKKRAIRRLNSGPTHSRDLFFQDRRGLGGLGPGPTVRVPGELDLRQGLPVSRARKTTGALRRLVRRARVMRQPGQARLASAVTKACGTRAAASPSGSIPAMRKKVCRCLPYPWWRLHRNSRPAALRLAERNPARYELKLHRLPLLRRSRRLAPRRKSDLPPRPASPGPRQCVTVGFGLEGNTGGNDGKNIRRLVGAGSARCADFGDGLLW
jgi:hypothetical protein